MKRWMKPFMQEQRLRARVEARGPAPDAPRYLVASLSPQEVTTAITLYAIQKTKANLHPDDRFVVTYNLERA